MKSSYLSVSLLSLITLSAAIALPVPQASAQCVMNDTSIQMSMHGSKKPGKQSNEVTQGSTGPCVGNTVNTTNVQNDHGSHRAVDQSRTSNQQVNGTKNSPSGINLKPIKTHQDIKIDITNPADRLKH
jgi:hypothetical protein